MEQGETINPRSAIWALPVVLLTGAWLLLAYRSGGYLPGQWLSPGLAVAFFGLVTALACSYPRRPYRLSLGVLGLLLLYALWVLASAGWALSANRVWDEAGRTFLYLAFFALALTFLTDPTARTALRYLLLAAGLLLVGMAAWRLATGGAELPLLFTERRLSYPVTYPNNAAALYLLLFWPLLGLAADPGQRVPLRGLALGTSSALLQLAVLTQSRGAAWALGVTAILAFVLLPSRLRTLFYLLAPVVLLVYSFPHLNRYWLEGLGPVDGWLATWHILVTLAVGTFAGLVLALLEGWVRVSGRMKLVFGSLVLLALAAGLVYGYARLERAVADPRVWVAESWESFTADQRVVLPGAGEQPGSRFLVVSASNRWDIWRVAWQDFRESPWGGVGAGNFVFTYDRYRHTENSKPRQPHSFELRVLSETGAVGGILVFGAFALALGGVLWPRLAASWGKLRGGRRRAGEDDGSVAAAAGGAVSARSGSGTYGWPVALLLGFSYWLVHGSVEWIWHMPGVTLGAFLLLALALAEVQARRQPPPAEGGSPDLPSGVTSVAPTTADRGAGPLEDGPLQIIRRTDRYDGRRKRRSRREARRARNSLLLLPPGPLSHVYRWLLATVSLGLFVGLALPYLSLRVNEQALTNLSADPVVASAGTRLAATLQPLSPDAFHVRAEAYLAAARSAAATAAGPDSFQDALALALAAREEAASRDDADWANHYLAGLAALNLLAARDQEGAEVSPAGNPLPEWTADERAAAGRLRELSDAELRELARNHLLAAQERNPLNREIADALAGP